MAHRYIPKELLWPYIPEFVDGALSHVVNMARALGEQVDGGKPMWPYVIHGHYADAGEVAARLSGALNVPMVLTGHSLGRNKFEQLLKQGRLSREDINSTYKIMRRIEGEELGLDAAEMVVTSTRQEIEEQWGLYDGFDIKLERKLRVRRRRGVSCLGRYMPRMVVCTTSTCFVIYIDHDLHLGCHRHGFLPNHTKFFPKKLFRFCTFENQKYRPNSKYIILLSSLYDHYVELGYSTRHGLQLCHNTRFIRK